MPTTTVGATCTRSSFGALVRAAMTHKAAAANINRMAKKVNGPASCVPYRATTKPVLHNNTNSAGAYFSNFTCG